MSLYIIRHGQTDWNILKKAQGRVDIALNANGREQAKETREKLKNVEIDLIICSPLKRAMQTAEIINCNRNIPIIYDERIIERNCGEFEGRTKEEYNFEEFWSYKKNINYEKAENVRDFFNRIYLFLDDIKDKYEGKNVLLVTHGGVSIPVNCYFNGIPEDDNLTKAHLKNCAYWKYEF